MLRGFGPPLAFLGIQVALDAVLQGRTVDGDILGLRLQSSQPGFGSFPVPQLGRLSWIELLVRLAGDPDHACAILIFPFGLGRDSQVLNPTVRTVATVEGERHTLQLPSRRTSDSNSRRSRRSLRDGIQAA